MAEIKPPIILCAYCYSEIYMRYGRHLQTCSAFRQSRGLPSRIRIEERRYKSQQEHFGDDRDTVCSCIDCNKEEDISDECEEDNEEEEGDDQSRENKTLEV